MTAVSALIRRQRALPILAALAVGLIYAFPNIWWLATSPDYSIIRGYIMSDDDIAPYSSGLSDAVARPLPPLTAYNRAYETRTSFQYAALSNWLTNLMLGNALRWLGSLERFVPFGLFLSGAATFLLLYVLARRFLAARAGALLVSLFACFRYPFYVSALTVARRLLVSGGGLDLASMVRASFPGMVNGYMLYPYLRWPVPGMMFFWFLLALLFALHLAQSAWGDAPARFPVRAMALTGGWIGLSAYVYFFFWSYLVALLALLTAVAWLMRRRPLALALLGAGLIAGLVSAPFWLSAAGVLWRSPAPIVTAEAVRAAPAAVAPLDPETLLVALSTHGLLAFAALLAPAIAGSNVSATTDYRRVVLFCLHLVVVILAALELLGFRALQAWHWSRYIMDCLLPLTVAWLLAQAFKRASSGAIRSVPRWAWGVAGLGLTLAAFTGAAVAGPGVKLESSEAAWRTLAALAVLVPGMAALAARPWRRWIAAAGVSLTVPIWLLYHRTVAEISWVAFVPLGLWAAGHKPRAVLAACTAFTTLNVMLGASLQLAVRPTAAKDFFSQPAEITDALRWLNSHTQLESVVTTNGWLGDSRVRAYTHDLTLAVPEWWTNVPAAERQRRQLVRAAIYQAPADELAEWKAARPGIVREFKSKVNDEWIGDQSMDFLTEEQAALAYDPEIYQELTSLPLAQLLGLYRIDYVWVGPWERYAGRRDFDSAPEVALVYQNDLVQIYQVRR